MDAKYLKENLQGLVDEYSDEAQDTARFYFANGKSKVLEKRADIANAENQVAKRFMAHLSHLLGQIAGDVRKTDKDD